MGYARTWTIRSTIIGNNIAHGNLPIAVKKPQAQLQFHRSQRRRRTCDWRSCVMSKILFDVHELENILKIWDTWACLPKKSECILFGFLSAQELENGRLAMFAFSGIVTQVAQWSEMWALQTWMRIYPQVSLFTKPLRTYSVLSYLDLFGTQNLLLMT